jgi:hypothetical protein
MSGLTRQLETESQTPVSLEVVPTEQALLDALATFAAVSPGDKVVPGDGVASDVPPEDRFLKAKKAFDENWPDS